MKKILSVSLLLSAALMSTNVFATTIQDTPNRNTNVTDVDNSCRDRGVTFDHNSMYTEINVPKNSDGERTVDFNIQYNENTASGQYPHNYDTRGNAGTKGSDGRSANGSNFEQYRYSGNNTDINIKCYDRNNK